MKTLLETELFQKIFKNNKCNTPVKLYEHLNIKTLRIIIVCDLQPLPKYFNSPFILVIFTAYFENPDLWRAFVVMLILELRRIHLNLVFIYVGKYADSIRTENCIKDDKRFLSYSIENLNEFISLSFKHLGMHSIIF